MNRIFRISVAVVAAFLFTMTPRAADAQWVLLDAKADAMVRKGLDAMYDLHYERADSIFNEMTREYPDHPAGYFLLALVDWWRIVPNIAVDSKVERFSNSFNQRIDKTLEICDARLEKNSADMIGLFFKGSALGYRARLKVTRNFSATSVLDWPSVLMEGKEAYNIILQCQRMAPSNSDVLLGSGIYNYMAAYVPEQYPIAKPFVSFLGPGDRQLGIQMLRISGQRAQYASVEAKYSLMEILTEFQKDYPAALEVAKDLYTKYPNNPIFHKYLAKNYYMTNDYADADTTWTEILRRVKRREPGYELTLARQGLYYLGDVLLRQGRYEDALRRFDEAIHQSERLGEDETSWIVMSELKVGCIYDLMGRRADALRQYKKVLAMDEFGSSRTNAKKYMSEPYKN